MKKTLTVDVVDAIQELQRDALPGREPERVIPLRDVSAKSLVTELHAVLVAFFRILVDLDDVREPQPLHHQKLLFEALQIADADSSLRAFDGELGLVVRIHIGVDVRVRAFADHVQLHRLALLA